MRKAIVILVTATIFFCLWNLHQTDISLLRGMKVTIQEMSKPKSVVSIQDTIETAMKSVVYIRVNGEDGWGGSGMYIGEGLIMTARHLVQDGEVFDITFEGGEKYISCCAVANSDVDVGFIFIAEPECAPLEFCTDEPRRGDTVYALGNPYGLVLKFSVTRGIISAVGREHDGLYGSKAVIQADAATYPGDSGCPVVNEQGKVIGMNVGNFGNDECIGVSIPAEVCRQAIEARRVMQEFK